MTEPASSDAAKEREVIVAWLRADAKRSAERAETARHPAQIESLNGHVLMLRFLAQSIERGDHLKTREQVQAEWAERLNLPWDAPNPQDGDHHDR